MIQRRLAVPVLVASLLLAACRRDPPPPVAEPTPAPTQAPPAPTPPPAGPNQDSIARVEAARAAARAALTEMVFFDYDMSEIRPDGEMVLRAKIPVLQASPAVQLRLEGHADERGSTEYNVALGTRRAESVRMFLMNAGLAANRFTITSYGEERPRAMGSSEAAWAQNRRVEFVITAGENQINVPMTDR